MADRQNRVSPYHPRPRVAHDGLDAAAHFRLVAMYRALVADRLPNAERTSLNPFQRIGRKPIAISTQPFLGTVAGVAMNSDHGGNGLGFRVHGPVLLHTPPYSKVESTFCERSKGRNSRVRSIFFVFCVLNIGAFTGLFSCFQKKGKKSGFLGNASGKAPVFNSEPNNNLTGGTRDNPSEPKPIVASLTTPRRAPP